MKGLLKILFGAVLGAVGCFAWDFYQAGEMEKKGLKREWVPIAAKNVVPAPVKSAPVSPATPTAPAAAKKPVLPTPKPAPTPVSTPVAPAAPVIKPEFYKRLAAEWWRWPATVKVREAQRIKFSPPGGGSIEYPIAAGTIVRLWRTDITGTRVFVFAKGSPFDFPIQLYTSDTDMIATAKPEGTPQPPPRPAKVATTSPRPAPTKTTSRNTGRGSAASAPNDNDGPANLPPPPPSGPAPTLFGVPIR